MWGGVEERKQRIFNWQCVGFSEIDGHAVSIYKRQFPTHKNFGDAKSINPDELPEFDLLCGGFPCQSFSIAGKRKGFQDTRGTLFYEILRIAKARKPRFLLLENVKGLLSADNGRCFATIISSLDELGYDVEWEVLNSKYFGVPQNRERVFIIGHSRSQPSRQIFPLGKCNNESSETPRETREEGQRIYDYVANTVLQREYKSDNQLILQINNPRHQNERIYSEDGISPTLPSKARGNTGTNTPIILLNNPNHSNYRIYGDKGVSPSLNTAQGGNRQPKILTAIKGEFQKTVYSPEGISPTVREGHGDAVRIQVDKNTESMFALRWRRTEKGKENRRQSQIRGKDYTPFGEGNRELYFSHEEVSGCVTSALNKDALLGNKLNIRRLTPTECCRLQGFPPDWCDIGIDECGKEVKISDTQKYRCLGNAVTTNVITAIVEKMIEAR